MVVDATPRLHRVERRRRDRPVRGVTSEQRRTLRIVTALTLLEGRSPSLSEIAAQLRISKDSAFDRLHWLAKKNLWCRSSRVVTPLGRIERARHDLRRWQERADAAFRQSFHPPHETGAELSMRR